MLVENCRVVWEKGDVEDILMKTDDHKLMISSKPYGLALVS